MHPPSASAIGGGQDHGSRRVPTHFSAPRLRSPFARRTLLGVVACLALASAANAAPSISAESYGQGNVRISWRRSSSIRRVEIYEGNSRRKQYRGYTTRRNYVTLYGQSNGTHYYFARFYYHNGRQEDSRVQRVSISGLDQVSSSGYRLQQTIDNFQVERNGNYLPRSGKTYCNVFAADVALKVGVALPNGKYPWRDGRYYNANMLYTWLRGQEARNYGWSQVSDRKAQEMANEGKFAVAVWYNTRRGESGHIAVIRPYGWSGRYSTHDGPRIAQAGARNYNDTVVRKGFGGKRGIVYYVNSR